MRAIVRRKERKRFPDSPEAKDVNYHFESLDFPVKDRRLNAYHAEFHPLAPEKVRRHHHTGVDLIYVMSGELEVRVGNEEHTLAEGDAMYFDCVRGPRIPQGGEEALHRDRGFGAVVSRPGLTPTA